MNSGEDNKRMNAGLINALGGNTTPAPTPMLDSIQRNQQAALTSNPKTFPTPWRIEHANAPIADTGDYDCVTSINAANGAEVFVAWNASDEQEEAFQRLVAATNAHETTAPRTPLALAIRFHETYERLAPSFGYETRPDTKMFDPGSKNGRLMVAVCAELFGQPVAEPARPPQMVAQQHERIRNQLEAEHSPEKAPAEPEDFSSIGTVVDLMARLVQDIKAEPCGWPALRRELRDWLRCRAAQKTSGESHG